MSDQPTAPADPVAAEDSFYAAVVSEYRGLRRNGASLVEAAAITGAHWLFLLNAAGSQDDG